MTREEVVDFYVAIPLQQKCFFLFSLAFQLDRVCMSFSRDLQRCDDEGAIRFGGFSELMHQIAAEAQHQFATETERSPDVFMRMLLETSESAHIAPQFAIAFQAAARLNLESMDS